MKRKIFILVCLVMALGCEREERGFRVKTPDANRIDSKQMGSLAPGLAATPVSVMNEYEGNAFALSEGKRLFSQMNCVGCHAYGGGAIGPALMDDKWIYGSRPEQIFATIVEGRPNGMPSFRGKLPDYEVWQLVAYVRSLSGNVPKDAAPGRSDDLQIGKPENSRKRQPPTNSSMPSAGQ